MKRCPECGRNYNDDSMSFCLDDGVELLFGPASADEPVTAILSEPGAVATVFPGGETSTRAQVHATDKTSLLSTAGEAEPQSKLEDASERQSLSAHRAAKPQTELDESPDGQSPSAHRAAKPLIAAAVAVIVLAGGFFVYRYLNPAVSDQINSIAVLPFTNAGGEAESEFLSDGIAETLINNFTKIPELKVTARSTAFRFRGREGEPKVVGSELGVDSMLTGRLTQRGDSLSIQVDLINTADGSQIWGNRYEGRPSDVVNIQQRIATDVSAQLRLKLSGAQARQLAKTYTQNSEAYQHYLRGRYHWNKRTADDLRKGLLEFQQAADIDPGYAMAYVGLADTYVLLEEYAGMPASESLPKAQAFAQRALEMDDSIGEAHATLGLINTYMWRWSDAERELKRAIELNPNYPTAHHWYSVLLNAMDRRRDEAMSEIKRAQELDPLSGIIGLNVGIVFIAKNDPVSAEAEFRRIAEFDPNWWGGHFYLGLAYLERGRHEEALAALEKAAAMTNRTGRPMAVLGYAYGIIGKRQEAQALIKELEEKYDKRQANGQSIAAAYVGLGDKDQALAWLQKDFEARSGDLIRVSWYPPFRPLHDDARFKSLMKQMAFPD